MSRWFVSAIGSLKGVGDFDRAFDSAFVPVAFALNRHLVDHMLRSARLMTGGDIDALIVLGVLGHQGIAHLMPPGRVPTAVLTEGGRLKDQDEVTRPMLLRDIAEIVRMPRETVRRKLLKLEAQALVRRLRHGWVVSDARVEPELREFTRESTLRLLAAADEIRAMLEAAEGPARNRKSIEA